MIKYLTVIILTLFLTIGAFAKPSITLTDAQGKRGDIVNVDLKVKDFRSLFSFQFTITFDPAKLKIRTVKNITSRLEGFDGEAIDYAPINADRGLITISYFNVKDDNGFNLPDGEVLFTLEFEIIGGSNSATKVDIPQSVEFGEFARDIEVLDNNLNDLGMSVTAGTVTIGEGGSSGPGRIGLILGSASGKNGETICIPLTVSDFNGVIGMQFSIAFSSDFMDFIEAKNFNLTGFNSASVSSQNDRIIITWNTPDTDPISKSDGSKIVDLCFKIKKSSGSSNVSFSNSPQTIELYVPDGSGGTTTVDGNLTNGRVSAGDGGGETGDVECDLPGFSIAASNETSPKGSEVCVDIVGKKIERFGILQTIIEWDPTVLSNPWFEAGKIDLDAGPIGNYSLDQGANGRAILSWTYDGNDQQGITAENNSVLFKLCFDVIGNDGARSEIKFIGDNNTFQLAGDVDGNPIDFQACDGSVTVGETQNVTVKSTSPTCFGDKDGSITLTVKGGTSPYTFTWKKDGQTVGNSATLSNVGGGKYNYTVVDSKGTDMGSGEVTLSEPNEIKIEGEVTPIENGGDGAIRVTVTGGSGSYMYNWSNGDDSQNISGLDEGSYTLTVTDGKGCSVNKSFNLGQGEYNVVIQATSNYSGFDISCNGESDARLRATASFGTAPYSYKWNTGDETESIQNVGAGKYTVTVTDGAGKTTKAEYTVNEPDKIVVRVATTPSNGTDAGTAKAEVRGGATPFRYLWNDKSPGSTTVFIGSLTEGTYRVSVTDANGCTAIGTGRVNIDDRECYTAVKVMTPNADGLNDELRIACVEGTFNMLRVFDRWGRLVYQEENYDNRWTGMDSNGHMLGDGVYYYVLDIDTGAGREQYKGHVTLLRELN